MHILRTARTRGTRENRPPQDPLWYHLLHLWQTKPHVLVASQAQIRCIRADTRGTKPPTHGAKDAHHHSPTSQSQGRSSSGLTDTYWHATRHHCHGRYWVSKLSRRPLSLHLSENELIPMSLVMHSASGTNLPILGVALLRIRVQLTGIEAHQMVYFSSMATKLPEPCNLRGPGADPKRVPLQHTDATSRETARRLGQPKARTRQYHPPSNAPRPCRPDPPIRTPLTQAYASYGKRPG